MYAAFSFCRSKVTPTLQLFQDFDMAESKTHNKHICQSPWNKFFCKFMSDALICCKFIPNLHILRLITLFSCLAVFFSCQLPVKCTHFSSAQLCTSHKHRFPDGQSITFAQTNCHFNSSCLANLRIFCLITLCNVHVVPAALSEVDPLSTGLWSCQQSARPKDDTNL